MTGQRHKRKRNPLSQARGKQNEAESVWFRRSGAGYQLFVEYYAAQPHGTVVGDEASRVDALPTATTAVTGVSTANKSAASTNTVKRQGAGLSRASKRRKRKKRNGPVEERQTTNKSASSIPAETAILPATPAPSPLLQVVLDRGATQTSASYQRLIPFLTTLSRPLPLTFRLRQTSDNKALQKVLFKYQDQVRPALYHPSIYQATETSALSKKTLAKSCPGLHEFLMQHSQNGSLARQEIGSMLPVLALSSYIEPGSRVLDLCAAPGSKTLQALEVVGSKGMVVANDVAPHRLEALQQAVERSGLSSQLMDRIVYTCQDATQFGIKDSVQQEWDAILCDVPCSGDGTCRKDAHILPSWKPQHGNALHQTQLRILTRALNLINNGLVCYSTCSMNPVENEAVVAAALQQYNSRGGGHVVELLELTGMPELVRRPGVSDWKVADYVDGSSESDNDDDEVPRLRWHETFQDAVEAGMDEPISSLWPPSQSDELHLERCARLWPQDQNTGGFFLALIRKTKKSGRGDP